MIERNIFGKNVLVFISIDLGRRRKDEFEFLAFLDLKNVPCPDNICRPQRVVILFTIDAAKLGCQVINKVVILFKYTLQLPEIGYVSPIIFLLGLMLEVGSPNVMASHFEFAFQGPSKGSHDSGNQYFC